MAKTLSTPASPAPANKKPRPAPARAPSAESPDTDKAPRTAGSHTLMVIVESPAKARKPSTNTSARRLHPLKASVGHVRDIPSKGLNVDVEDNFKPTYEITERQKNRDRPPRRCIEARADQVYLATDMDREGEARLPGTSRRPSI